MRSAPNGVPAALDQARNYTSDLVERARRSTRRGPKPSRTADEVRWRPKRAAAHPGGKGRSAGCRGPCGLGEAQLGDIRDAAASRHPGYCSSGSRADRAKRESPVGWAGAQLSLPGCIKVMSTTAQQPGVGRYRSGDQSAKDLSATVDSIRRVRSYTQPPSRRSANERT